MAISKHLKAKYCNYARTVPVAAGPLPEKKEDKNTSKFSIKSFFFLFVLSKKNEIKKGP